MKDYERNFWLPMKGVHKPVYAIPGNHDWYDALEGFAATFFDSTSARKRWTQGALLTWTFLPSRTKKYKHKLLKHPAYGKNIGFQQDISKLRISNYKQKILLSSAWKPSAAKN
jgi:DNA repair exonuclease SbcCD nuclease subunit